MKIITQRLGAYIFLLLLPAYLLAQDENPRNIQTVAADLIRNIRSGSKEILLVQTDKLVYAVTDRIWFKVFILDSVSEKLLATNGTLYIDVVDQRDQPIAQIFQHSSHRQSGGSIALPDSLGTGIYYLRAYTKFDSRSQVSNMVVRPLVIINSLLPARNELQPKKNNQSNLPVGGKWVAHIYPEGGHLMSGEDNLIGLKLEDQLGQPVSDSGLVKDRSGRVQLRFVTNSAGLAKFRFNPTARGKYDLYVRNGNRYDSLAAMPMVNFYGAQISVTEQNMQSVKLKVMLEDSLFHAQYKTYLIGIHKDSICFASVGQGMYQAFLPVYAFPAGVSRLLLFDEKGILLSERDIFLNQQQPHVGVKPAKDRYGPREKVDLDLRITDADGKPVLASYTISVTDKRLTDEKSIFFEDSLLRDSAQDIDLMLLTGYGKRTDRITPVQGISGMEQQEFNPFVFDGKLLNRKGLGLTNYQLSMLSIRKGFMVLQDTTGTNGAFNFIIPEFNDSLEIEFKAKALKGKEEDYLVQADPRHFPLLLTPPSNKSLWDASTPGYREKISRYQFDTLFAQAHGMLPAVTVSGIGPKKPPARADRANIINRDQLLAAGTDNVANLLLTIPGVHLSNGYLVMRGVTAFYPSPSDEPIVMMDGSQVNLRASGDAQNSSPVLAFLRTLNAREIESIRVLNGTDAAEFGVRGGHGVIDITTSPMTYFPKETIESKKFWIEGYRVPKTLAGREYKTKAAVENQYPDNRTTIYWNGDLVTDSQGSNAISFYTGDIVTDYIITVAGISSKGEKIYKTVILRM